MPHQQTPLDPHQQQLIKIIRAAHTNLAVARKVRTSELNRRIQAENLRLRQAFERDLEEVSERIRQDLDYEIVQHEAALDEALITAYNANVSQMAIAIDGFGNRYNGGVTALIGKLRTDGRLGNKDGYQRNTEEANAVVAFPEAVDVTAMLEAATTVNEPTYKLLPHPFWLVEPNDSGEGLSTQAVLLTMDANDPYFAAIAPQMRPGTRFRGMTTATIYKHPFTGLVVAAESRETSDQYWDHPVARYVKDNQAAVTLGFNEAIAQ